MRYEIRRAGLLMQLRESLNHPTQIDHSYASACLEAVVFPLAHVSSGEIDTAQGVWPYPAPRSLWSMAFENEILIWSTGGGSVFWGVLHEIWRESRESISWFCFFSIALGTVPLTFALLPVSRKRARIKWNHIFRVFLYSLYLPFVVLYAAVAAVAASMVFNDSWFPLEFWPSIVVVAMPVMTLAWWMTASRRYLKLPHAHAVAVAMYLLSLLSIAAVLWFADRHSLMSGFDSLLGG
jgi:hypothetical protein